MVHSKQNNDGAWLPDDDLVEALIRNSQENEIKLTQMMTERLAKPSFQPSKIPEMPKKTSEVWTLSKPENTKKKAPVRIIIGNPPYSVGQKSENDNAKNQNYTK